MKGKEAKFDPEDPSYQAFRQISDVLGERIWVDRDFQTGEVKPDWDNLTSKLRFRLDTADSRRRQMPLIIIVTVFVTGFLGFQVGHNRGEDRGWALAELRARRVWATGVCRGATTGTAHLAAAILGERSTVPIFEEGWGSIAEQLGSVAIGGSDARYEGFGGAAAYEIEQSFYRAIAEEVRFSREDFLEDPAVDEADIPTLAELKASLGDTAPSEAKYAFWMACRWADLEPDAIRDG